MLARLKGSQNIQKVERKFSLVHMTFFSCFINTHTPSKTCQIHTLSNVAYLYLLFHKSPNNTHELLKKAFWLKRVELQTEKKPVNEEQSWNVSEKKQKQTGLRNQELNRRSKDNRKCHSDLSLTKLIRHERCVPADAKHIQSPTILQTYFPVNLIIWM